MLTGTLRSFAVAPIFLLSTAGCFATSWGAGTLATEQQVALALGESAEPQGGFDSKALAEISGPAHVRPCCAFGMDLRVTVAGVDVPGYSVGNVTEAAALGRHEYDNGAMTLNQDLTRFLTLEKNGLVYTCRGGFVDTAHVRDNADLTLFLAQRIAVALPGPALISLKGDGAARRVVLKAVPGDLIERLGRWEVAITLAQWAAFQLSIWHEIVTWYGFESVPGFSEKVSAFSPEDLYSNAVGTRVAGGILRNQQIKARGQWNQLVNAWIPITFKRLGALPTDLGRRAMKTLDGRWWDSRKRLPDWTVVTRRQFDLSSHVVPWRLGDAQPPADDVLDTACAGTPTALPLDVPTSIGGQEVSSLVGIDFEVESWAPPEFPFPDPTTRRATHADLPRMVEVVRVAEEKTLGAGFDKPGPRVTAK